MRWIFYILIFLVLLLLAGYLFPREVMLDRSIYIDKPPQAVFPYVNNFRKFNSWSPWRHVDPSVQYQYSGPEQGVGAEMRWHGEDSKAGSGTQTITVSDPDTLVRTKLSFGDDTQALAEFQLQPQNGGTQVTWRFRSDTGGGPGERWMGLAVKKMVGQSYEEGLAELKNLLETTTSTPGPASDTTNSVSDIPSDVDDAMGAGPQGVPSAIQNQQQEEAGETSENE